MSYCVFCDPGLNNRCGEYTADFDKCTREKGHKGKHVMCGYHVHDLRRWKIRPLKSTERRKTVRAKRHVQHLKAEIAALIPKLERSFNDGDETKFELFLNELRQLSAV